MSELDKLLLRYCQSGVSRMELVSICKIETGRLNASAATKDGTYAFFTTAQEVYRTDSYRWNCDALLVAGNADVGNVKFYSGKFNAYQRTYVLSDFRKDVDVHYLYYALSSSLNNFLEKRKNNGAMSYVVLEDIESFTIPIPPLPVQQEIVRILDSFTNYTAELTAELTARKKQYEYYRDHLLDFDIPHKGELGRLLRQYCPNGVQRIKISDLFLIRNGYTPSTKVAKYWNGDTNIPWVRMDDIRANGNIISDASRHVTKAAVKKGGLFRAGSIIMATTATIGEHALLTADLLANQRFTNFEIRELQRDKVIPKYIYYYFYLVDEWAKKHADVGSFMSVDIEELSDLAIPVPPPPVQEYIVSILDQFETLTSDITTGLPAEIEARQKQYEYYRDKILSFDTI